MSSHAIPTDTNMEVLQRALMQKLRVASGIVYGSGIEQKPTAIEFNPDLTTEEETSLTTLFEYASSIALYEGVTNGMNLSPQEAADAFTNGVFGGQTLEQVDAGIDALPGTVAGMRTGLHQAAAAIISLRNKTSILAKATCYIRNLVIKIRMKWQ